MLVNGQLKTTTVIENTERQLEKVRAQIMPLLPRSSENSFSCRLLLKIIVQHHLNCTTPPKLDNQFSPADRGTKKQVYLPY